MTLFANVALVVLAGFLFLLLKLRVKARHKTLPSVGYYPIIGNLLQVTQNINDFYGMWTRMHQAYPKQCLQFGVPGGLQGVMMSTPENVNHVLRKNFKNYVKGAYMYEVGHPVFGDGIFGVDGAKWRQQRKQGSHMFSMKHLRDHMTPVFARGAQEFLDILDKAADSGEVVDIQDLFNRFTLEHFVEIAFGVKLGCLEKRHPFADAFDRSQEAIFFRNFDFTWKLKRLLNISYEKHLREDVKVLNEFAFSIIKNKREVANLDEQADLVSRFLSTAEKEGTTLDDQYIRDIVLNFIIAGRDTTAQTLTWAVHFLNDHPEQQKKLQREIDSALPDLEDVPEYQTVGALDYAHAVLSETLRIRPPVPGIYKRAVSDDVLPDGTEIRAGEVVLYSAYAMGHMDYIWGPQAAEWIPERWLEEKRGAETEEDDDGAFKSMFKLSAQPPDYKFPAFNVGDRACLGKPVAYLEAKMLLALLYRRYNIRVVPGHKIAIRNSVTLPMKHGLKVTISRRA